MPATGGRGDRRHHQGAERERLRHRGQPAQDTGADDDGQGTPRRLQVADDGGVERPHDVTLEGAGAVVGMWCTAIRLRKTQ